MHRIENGIYVAKSSFTERQKFDKLQPMEGKFLKRILIYIALNIMKLTCVIQIYKKPCFLSKMV